MSARIFVSFPTASFPPAVVEALEQMEPTIDLHELTAEKRCSLPVLSWTLSLAKLRLKCVGRKFSVIQSATSP